MEDLKSFRIELSYADEKGKRSTKEMTIKINKPVLQDKSAWVSKKYTYAMSFSLQIPEHIHSFIIGKSVPRKDSTRDYPIEYTKTLNAQSLDTLTKTWEDLLNDYIWLKDVEGSEYKKVIFYIFDTEAKRFKSYYNSIDLGQHARIDYSYAIGFIKNVNGFSREFRFNHQKLMVSTSDSTFSKMKYVEWSEEREAFFANINNSFDSIIAKIQSFKEKMTEDSIDSLISIKNLLNN